VGKGALTVLARPFLFLVISLDTGLRRPSSLHFRLKNKSPLPLRGSLKLKQRAICTVLLDPRDLLLQSERTQSFAADLDYGRVKCLPMFGEIKT
jgi:hypothetical protein